jgi:sulfur-oxidizing protein SoxY
VAHSDLNARSLEPCHSLTYIWAMKNAVMTKTFAHSLLNRRTVLALTGAAAAGFYVAPAFGQSMWERVEEARVVIGDSTPLMEGVSLDIPLVSENGATVPVTVSVDRPMTDESYVQSIHLFAPGNPFPEVAVFHFTPLAGQANVATRVRLNESQTVLAVARLSTGEVLVGEREVRVTVTGCLTNADTYDSENLFQTRVRAPEGVAAGQPGEVLTIINHPMETGLREDFNGNIVEKRIIERMEAEFDGQPVFTAELNRSISANPYVRFFIAPQHSGTLALKWTEDTGESVEASAEIAV